ncbi:MAG: DUF5011 domain-containing protein [Erysipelotrichaceae bacterium]
MNEMIREYKKLLVISVAFVTFLGTGVTLSMNGNIHKDDNSNVADARNISDNVYNEKTIVVNYGEKNAIKKIIKAVELKDVDSINIPIEVSKEKNKNIYSYGNLTLELEYFNANKAGKQLINLNVKKKEKAKDPINKTLLVASTNQDEIVIDEGITKTYKLLVEVVDKNAPVIELVDNEATLEFNEEFNASDYVNNVYDEVDGTIDYSVDSNVDTSVAGDYTVVYTASDSNGNKATATLNVNVKEKAVARRNISYSATYDVPQGSDMISAINAVRAQNGLYPLMLDTGNLGAAAQQRAMESAYNGFYHYRPDGSSYTTVLNQYGVSYNSSVELLVSYGGSYSSNLSWWLSSPTHAPHILTSTFTKIGLGNYNGCWAAILTN